MTRKLTQNTRLFASIAAVVMLAACGENQVNPSALAEGALLTASCSNCHASNSQITKQNSGQTSGQSPQINIPILSGFSEDKMAQSLNTYKTDHTGSTVMHYMARGWTDEEIAVISKYLGTKP